jgi:hypothetical protein
MRLRRLQARRAKQEAVVELPRIVGARKRDFRFWAMRLNSLK